MTKIISIVNQKGGVGKTTTVINVSAVFSALGKRVLIIDFDSQSNATSGLGITINESKDKNIYTLLLGEKKVEEVIFKTKIPLLDIIPSSQDLAAIEVEMTNIENREFILKNSISSIINNYDFIFIDCPPSLSLLTINALCCSTSILIPLQCEFFSLQGLSNLLETANRIKANYNNSLRINGIILTMYDKRNKITDEIEKDVRNCFGEMVYKTVIPRNVKISESTSHGLPVVLYDSNCIGSIAYKNLSKELIEKLF